MRCIIDLGFADEAHEGLPPEGVYCWLLCGEFGYEAMWYWGRMWQSKNPDGTPAQNPVFYSDEGDNPPFHLPVYRGKYILKEDFPIN